jgi:hypothetical protein
MSEVDRLSNSGLYPVLPLGDQRRKDGSGQQQRRHPTSSEADPPGWSSSRNGPRPPKSLIDEYA